MIKGGNNIVDASGAFAGAREKATFQREHQDALRRDEEKEKARTALAAEIKAIDAMAERCYSPLVEKIRGMYAALLMTDGTFLDVHATKDIDQPVTFFQTNAELRGAVKTGAILVSLDLTQPFSTQWPSELDGLTASKCRLISLGHESAFGKSPRFYGGGGHEPTYNRDASGVPVSRPSGPG